MGRIAQYDAAGGQYFLGDALGSVRQIVDASGEVLLAQSYEPYGEVLASAGEGNSSYGFTGEMQDSYIKLIYLRSRMYSPVAGRFLTKDSWQGDYTRPYSLHNWNYAYSNPIRYSDPSGKDPWWCDGRIDEALCYAEWIVAHGGKPNADLLEAVYEYHPDQAIGLLKKAFSIRLPNEYTYRFAYNGFGALDQPLIDIEAFNPWFFVEQNAGIDAKNWLLEAQYCRRIDSAILESLMYIDSSVYILDISFSRYEFNPDDIASVMIHEAVHAWQESVALVQVGEKVTTSAWISEYKDGLERQAYDMERKLNGVRTQLSLNRLKRIEAYRGQHTRGPDSPFSLPPGVP